MARPVSTFPKGIVNKFYTNILMIEWMNVYCLRRAINRSSKLVNVKSMQRNKLK